MLSGQLPKLGPEVSSLWKKIFAACKLIFVSFSKGREKKKKKTATHIQPSQFKMSHSTGSQSFRWHSEFISCDASWVRGTHQGQFSDMLIISPARKSCLKKCWVGMCIPLEGQVLLFFSEKSHYIPLSNQTGNNLDNTHSAQIHLLKKVWRVSIEIYIQ